MRTRPSVRRGRGRHNRHGCVNTVGLGPHRIDRASRPGWFFERERSGGILADIASHQIEQFLFFTGAEDAEVATATVANRANPAHPELQDFGDMLLRTSETADRFLHSSLGLIA
jgi:predicted dehydrogenase